MLPLQRLQLLCDEGSLHMIRSAVSSDIPLRSHSPFSRRVIELPWTVALLCVDTATWFPSVHVQRAWARPIQQVQPRFQSSDAVQR